MKRLLLLPVVLLALSCDNRLSSPSNFEGGNEVAKSEAMMAQAGASQVPESTTERKLIRTGFLTMTVDNAQKSKSDIIKICKEYKAYISSDVQIEYDDRKEYEQVIRIPAADFDMVINKVEAVGKDVKNKNIQSSDVTEEFIDKEARIKTKKELENRYREILHQARNVFDILAIEAQLNSVRAEIESMEGRLNYLASQVAFSTLTLRFHEPIGAGLGFGSKTVAALATGWDLLLVLVIAIVHIWPLLLIAVVSFFIGRKNRFRKKVSGSDHLA